MRETLDERFWAKVQKTEGCWLWMGATNRSGYGLISRYGKSTLAHRASWELARGPIPEGLCVLHKCDTPACVRPTCLFLGTMRDNTKDMMAKNRHGYKPQPRPGTFNANAKLTDEQVSSIRARQGQLHRELAKEFNVSRQLIGSLRSNKHWTHIA